MLIKDLLENKYDWMAFHPNIMFILEKLGRVSEPLLKRLWLEQITVTLPITVKGDREALMKDIQIVRHIIRDEDFTNAAFDLVVKYANFNWRER